MNTATELLEEHLEEVVAPAEHPERHDAVLGGLLQVHHHAAQTLSPLRPLGRQFGDAVGGEAAERSPEDEDQVGGSGWRFNGIKNGNFL